MNFKKFSVFDIGLTKLAVFSAALFLISALPEFANWTIKTPWAWFLAAAIIFSVKPFVKAFKK
jgi:hypothetical protein